MYLFAIIFFFGVAGLVAVGMRTELMTAESQNNKWDEGESYIDADANGKWDDAESFTDAVTANGKYDEWDDFVDENGNGKWDDAESFTDAKNGQYDKGEEFVDKNKNGKWDDAEDFQDKGMSENTYNVMMTLHGAIMVFMFIIPSIPAALGNLILPILSILLQYISKNFS